MKTTFLANLWPSGKHIATGKPGPIGAARNCKSPSEIFIRFMPLSLATKINNHTNQKVKKIKEQNKYKYDASEATNSEILVFLGISVISGEQQADRHDIEDLQNSDETEMDLLRSVMSYKRFEFFFCQTRFDERAIWEQAFQRPSGPNAKYF